MAMCVRSCTSLVVFGPILSESDVKVKKKKCCVNWYTFLKMKHVIRVFCSSHKANLLATCRCCRLWLSLELSVLVYFFCLLRIRYINIEALYAFGIFCPCLWTYIPVSTNARVCFQATGCEMLDNLTLGNFYPWELLLPSVNYHSTSAPYWYFIHLPSTLYNLGTWKCL